MRKCSANQIQHDQGLVLIEPSHSVIHSFIHSFNHSYIYTFTRSSSWLRQAGGRGRGDGDQGRTGSVSAILKRCFGIPIQCWSFLWASVFFII